MVSFFQCILGIGCDSVSGGCLSYSHLNNCLDVPAHSGRLWVASWGSGKVRMENVAVSCCLLWGLPYNGDKFVKRHLFKEC